MVVRESTVFLEKRESDFDKTMKIIQSHHLNDYNDCTVQRLCTGCKISKEQSLGRFIKPYLMGYLTIFAKKIGVAEATPKIVILSCYVYDQTQQIMLRFLINFIAH